MTAGERELLDRLLAAHEPADDEERADREQVLDFVRRHEDPFDRRIVEGHLTGSAFVLDPAARLLLTHHRQLDIWIQLGGHAESERLAHEVALREAREESGLPDLAFHAGLRLPGGEPRLLDVDVHRIPARRGEPAHLHLDLRFALTTQRPETIVLDPAEAHALEWLPLSAARERGEPGMRRAIDKLQVLASPAA